MRGLGLDLVVVDGAPWSYLLPRPRCGSVRSSQPISGPGTGLPCEGAPLGLVAMLLTLEPCAHHLGGGICASSRNFGHVWFSRRAEGQRSRTTTTSEAADAGPPPGPLCPPSSGPPQRARTAGPRISTAGKKGRLSVLVKTLAPRRVAFALVTAIFPHVIPEESHPADHRDCAGRFHRGLLPGIVIRPRLPHSRRG